MPFPREDSYWTEVQAFLAQHASPRAAILAPNDFLEFFPGTYHYNISHLLPIEQLEFVVFHKGMVTEVDAALAHQVVTDFQPVLANPVFVVYAKTAIPEVDAVSGIDVDSLLHALEQQPVLPPPKTCAIVVTTYNRPECLRRSLPQLYKLGAPIVVVDDGSTAANASQNQELANLYSAKLIRIPDNRGLPNAINVGVEYWLADPDIAWISYFQDDVDVRSDILDVLAKLQHPTERPLLAGQEAPEHPIVETREIAGYSVLLKRSMPGQHLHAHRDYWRAVLPIPTPYLGAPKPDRGKPGQGADEDWWITAWSPQSIAKQGGYVVCIPGLVTTFRPSAAGSTWGNQSGVGTEAVSQLSEPSLEGGVSADASNLADPNLEGVKVLVDGYNLQLTKGTGIKTYGLSLVQALNDMGASVDVLLSRGGSKKNAILDEVIFFDNQSDNQNWVNLSKWLIKSVSPFYRAKRRDSFSGLVVKRGQYSDEFLRYATSFSLPQCYDLANGLYQKFRLTTRITIPEKMDVWHATYPLPMRVRGVAKITTIHDLIPLRLPYATLDNKEVFYFKVRDALKDSQVIITVSENSKRDLLQYFDVDADRVVVTYQPIALAPLEDLSQEQLTEALQQFGLMPQHYLLFVGAIEPKKNVGRLIDAYASLDTDLPLVIVGKKGWLWDEELGKLSYLFDSKTSSKTVKLLEYVSAQGLRYLYRGAYSLVFPSLYEGFGLPPVEAMNFGCPVITSNVSCLPEICGDAALYVDPYDSQDIKQKLEMILSDRQLRQQLIQAGKQTAAQFSLENYRQRLHQAYTKALS
jgi:glycosyltransferase involved in cell wall biosynthesis